MPSPPPCMDLLLHRAARRAAVAAMSHWEASPFDTKDGQDVVKAKGAHVVSEGWEKVVSKDSGGGSSGGSIVASLAAPLGVMPLIGDGSSTSLPHWQKAFLLLVGGFVVYYIRRLLRSKRRPARAAAVNEVGAPTCTALHRPVPSRTGLCYMRCLFRTRSSPPRTRSQKFSSPEIQEQLRTESQGQGRVQRVERATRRPCLQQPKPGQPPFQRAHACSVPTGPARGQLLEPSQRREASRRGWVSGCDGESCGGVLVSPRL